MAELNKSSHILTKSKVWIHTYIVWDLIDWTTFTIWLFIHFWRNHVKFFDISVQPTNQNITFQSCFRCGTGVADFFLLQMGNLRKIESLCFYAILWRETKLLLCQWLTAAKIAQNFNPYLWQNNWVYMCIVTLI